MDGISKEFLCKCLNDTFLVNALEQKRSIKQVRQNCLEAIRTIEFMRIKEGLAELDNKVNFLTNLCLNYDTMIDSTWGLQPWQQYLISNYLDIKDCDVDKLKDFITK